MPFRPRLLAAFLILLVVGGIVHLGFAGLDNSGLATSTAEIVKADGSRVRITLDVALSPERQLRGLMFVKHMDDDRGMIFPFAPQRRVSFWMKNTLIPLDMLFIGRGGVISQIAANAIPGDLTPISSKDEVEAVLEVNGGFADKHGIRVGDRVESSIFLPH